MLSQSTLDILSKNCILSKAENKNIQKYFTEHTVWETEFSSGDIIISPQKKQCCVGIILSGNAFAEPTNSKENALLRMLSDGDMFGISNLYGDNLPFPSIIIAKSSTKVFFIKGDAFRSLIECDKNALRAYLSLLSNKIIFLNKKNSTLTAGTTEKKLAAFLLENLSQETTSKDISMSSLADMLGVGRASLYRAFDALEHDGIVRRDGKKIIICNRSLLKQII